MKCEDCRYWDQSEFEELPSKGYCRQKSPGAYPAGYNSLSLWPVTVKSDWCGEFKEKEG